MISPQVRIVDVDPAGFAWLNRLLAASDLAGAGTVTVLHDGGRVVRAVHSGTGDVAFGAATVDVAAPAALRHRLGADHLVLLDRSALPDLAAAVAGLGRSCATQPELLWRAREAWNACPGVVQDPPPAPSRWPAVAARLAAVADGAWVVATCTGAPAWRLAARVEGGALVEITSAVPEDATVHLSLTATAESWEAVLSSDDPLAALEATVEATTARRADR